MLIEEYVGGGGGCVAKRQGSCSSSTPPDHREGRQERVARYKEERRRELEAQYGPREGHQTSRTAGAPTGVRTTRASRLRTLANQTSDQAATAGDKVGRGRRGRATSHPVPKSSLLVKRVVASTAVASSLPGESTECGGDTKLDTRGGEGVGSGVCSPLERRESGGCGTRPLSSLPTSPARHPTGILKKSSLDETCHPVSILKRKTSRDEGSGTRCSSPVKWSREVETGPLPSSRGILKKHRSLDEQHVSDSVLTTQKSESSVKGHARRCSLEEERSHSPDAVGPQGILKRKTSRDEESRQTSSILKRKVSPGRAASPDPAGLPPSSSSDARPILKKKSSEEECAEPPAEAPPRPILKKKSLEEEDHRVRPILKTKSDGPQEIRPILKNNDEVVMRGGRRVLGGTCRRSLDPNFVFPVSHASTPVSHLTPVSVAERILSLEGTPHPSSPHSSLRMEEEEDGVCSLSRSGSVSERASMWKKLEEENRAAAEARRVPKGTRGRAARGDPASRFSTQPVTLGEVQQAKRNKATALQCVDEGEEPSRLSLAERVRLFSSGGGGKAPSAIVRSPTAPPPRPLHQVGTSSIVAGLLKNIKDKAGSGGAVAVESDWEGSSGRRLLSETSEPCTECSDARRVSTHLSSESDSSDSEPSLSSSPRMVVVGRRGGEEVDASPLGGGGGGTGGSIAERLASLHRSGSTDWRNRLHPAHNDNEGDGGGGVAERLGRLQTASHGWKARVGEKDNHRFTVAGRMANIGLSPVHLPIIPPRTPAPQQVFSTHVEPGSTPATPETDTNGLNFIKRSASAPSNHHLKNLYNGTTVKGERTGPKISVPPVCDDNFHSFFPGYDPSTQAADQTIDLDNIDIQPSSLLVGARRVRMQRRHQSANPLKALARRSDLTTEYVEVRSGIAERELTRIKLDKLMASNRGLAMEAVVGLASREELGKVVLRPAGESPAPRQVAQWPHPLLLRIKGRRHPILSVVQPSWTSINQGDAFLLVTQNQVFCWCGEYCNVIEKSRACEAATDIQSRRDLGCLSASRVTHLEASAHSPQHTQFWSLLGLPSDKLSSYTGEDSGHPEEDELYESAVSGAYRSYTLEEGKLVPLDQAWARVPKVDCLDTTKVMVFDFVSEVYCWSGKHAGAGERRTGCRLAEALSAESPPWHPSGLDWLNRQATRERSCFIITQHMEPVLFREKFADWPDFKRNTNVENGNGPGKASKACDVKPMVSWEPPSPDLVLENSHLGRGVSYYDEETRRFFQVETVGVEVWKVEDHCARRVAPEECTHFSEDHSYIIKWNYSLTVTGRELSGVPSKHQPVGRERLAYMTWHGCGAGLETGTAALLAAGMDPGAAPHLVVRQGAEPPVVLALLPRPLVISSPSSGPRLFLVEPGQDPAEHSVLRQVPAHPSSLRPAASFWYVPEEGEESYLWHGGGSKASFRSAARDAVCSVASMPPTQWALSGPLEVTDTYHGSEPSEFLQGALEGSTTELGEKPASAVKMFELALVKGVFTATGISPFRHNPDPSSSWTYVYSQEELYGSQSRTVLVESHCGGETTVWLWSRVSPVPPEALTTLLSYSAAVGAEACHVVAAYAEPTSFTNLFPWWTPHHHQPPPEGWSVGEVRSGQQEVAKLSVRAYTIDELRSDPLPAGVDPSHLELYLHPEDFQDVLSVTKSEFDSLPSWKQLKLKKSAGLF